jgi:hypothetical protein
MTTGTATAHYSHVYVLHWKIVDGLEIFGWIRDSRWAAFGRLMHWQASKVAAGKERFYEISS